MPAYFLRPDANWQPVMGSADSNPHFQVTADGLRVKFSRAGDNFYAAVIASGKLYTLQGYYEGVTAAPANQLYAEPADYWNAYGWVDGTLTIDDAWLAANSQTVVDARDNIAKRQFRIGSRRNMTTGQFPVRLATTQHCWMIQSELMAVAGPGTARGFINNAGGALLDVDDCSFYGPHLNMATGQRAGELRLEFFRRLFVRNSNFIRTGGIRPQNLQTSGVDGYTFHAARNRLINTTGRYRDTASATGWNTSQAVDVGHNRNNHVQINHVPGIAGVYVGWNWGTCIAEDSDIEDCFNFADVTGTPASWALMERNLADGAYPWRVGQDFAGGGVIIGDTNGRYQRTYRNVVLNPTGYGVAISGGNDMRLEEDLVLDTGVVNGVPSESSPDNGFYIRQYYPGTPIPSTRMAVGLQIGKSAPTAGNPTRRQDFATPAVASDQGTFSNIQSITPGQVITQAQIDAARTQWQIDAALAGHVIGRRRITP